MPLSHPDLGAWLSRNQRSLTPCALNAVEKFANCQLRYYQRDFALCSDNGIVQTITSLLEDITMEKLYTA